MTDPCLLSSRFVSTLEGFNLGIGDGTRLAGLLKGATTVTLLGVVKTISPFVEGGFLLGWKRII